MDVADLESDSGQGMPVAAGQDFLNDMVLTKLRPSIYREPHENRQAIHTGATCCSALSTAAKLAKISSLKIKHHLTNAPNYSNKILTGCFSQDIFP